MTLLGQTDKLGIDCSCPYCISVDFTETHDPGDTGDFEHVTRDCSCSQGNGDFLEIIRVRENNIVICPGCNFTLSVHDNVYNAIMMDKESRR